MFKTDQKSLEELSFKFDERDISNLKANLEFLKRKDLLTISNEEYQNVMIGLDKIGALKMNGEVYSFHVYDSFANDRCGSEGIELYLRQGDLLIPFFQPGSRDYCYQIGDAICFLQKKGINKIYTGEISRDKGFLGINYECDEDDPIIKTPLGKFEIQEFEEEYIDVITLDSLL